MPRGIRKKTKQYVLDRFQEEDPEGYFKYKTKSTHGLTEDQLEFVQAVESHSVQKIRSLLNRGVDPNFIVLGKRQTPLHMAVESQCVSDAACEKILRVMLFFGADPNAVDSEGYSPLHVACIAGNSVAVELLLQAGADAGIVDSHGETPLMSVCRILCDRSSHIVDLLLSSGASVSCTNNEHQSVLHMLTMGHFLCTARMLSATDRHLIVKTFLKHGHSANTVDCYGLSPLCYELLLLLRSPAAISHLGKTAEVLMCGGAVLQAPKDFDELKSCFMSASLATMESVTCYLIPLLLSCRSLMPPQQHKFLMDMVKDLILRVGRPDPQALDCAIFSTQAVPRLTQLGKLSVIQCLDGYSFSRVEYLPLPQKMKDYICSHD